MSFSISFNKPPYAGSEEKYISETVRSLKISGDGMFTGKCTEWFLNQTGAEGFYLTTSCTHALELAAMAAGIHEGDEVIMPSYTFVSTANAFVTRGATAVFTDIRPDTMNIDETQIEDAITPKTRAIAPVHYAGVSCDMDVIMDIARRHHLFVIEDAAQGVRCTYRGKALGTFGTFGCFSFHETKNYSMGEGGGLVVNDSKYKDEVEIIREKGTNRRRFLRGQVDKYSWVSVGSSYLPSDINAAYLWAQLEIADQIDASRMRAWNQYRQELTPLAAEGRIELQTIPPECSHNGHMFYIKAADLEERTRLIAYLNERGIQALFHYVPLHSSEGGRLYGRFHGEDKWTTRESARLVRLPMYYQISEDEVSCVVQAVRDFYRK